MDLRLTYVRHGAENWKIRWRSCPIRRISEVKRLGKVSEIRSNTLVTSSLELPEVRESWRTLSIFIFENELKDIADDCVSTRWS